jgi:hypothetical protein
MICTLAAVTLTIGLVSAFGTPLWQEDGVSVSVASQSQSDPQIASDGSGGAIVSWKDYRSGYNYDIYAQRVDSNGDVLWLTDGVTISEAFRSQENPQIISDGFGGAIVVWEDTRLVDGDPDIFAQRVDGDGNTLWTDDGVSLCISSNTQWRPQIAPDGIGGAIVTWDDHRGTSKDIYAQRVDSNGNTLWQINGVSISVATNDQAKPQIVSDGSSGAIITWTDTRLGSSNYDIYAQRVYSDGTVAWTDNGVSLCVASGIQSGPRIVSDGAGGAIVSWGDHRPAAHQNDIYAQRVDGQGNTLWYTDGVSLCVASWSQAVTSIAPDGSGGAIVAWEDARRSAGSNYDIYAQRVDGDGNALWQTDGVSLTAASNDQEDIQIVPDGLGGAIVVWKDERSDSYGDIYAQRVDSDGNVLWQTDGVSLCVASYDQIDPRLVSDGLWGAIVTWEDNRENGFRDIYAQRVGVKPVRLPLVAKNHE